MPTLEDARPRRMVEGDVGFGRVGCTCFECMTDEELAAQPDAPVSEWLDVYDVAVVPRPRPAVVPGTMPSWVTQITQRYLDSATGDLPEGTEVEVHSTMWTDPNAYRQAAATARSMLSRFAEGAYSTATLDAVSNVDPQYVSESPVLIVVSAPMQYDDETECKTGGPLAVAVAWRERIALAVSRSYRRRGLGKTLVRQSLQFAPGGGLWVAARNVDAQHFLLETGLRPVAIGSRGVLRYALDEDNEA